MGNNINEELQNVSDVKWKWTKYQMKIVYIYNVEVLFMLNKCNYMNLIQ